MLGAGIISSEKLRMTSCTIKNKVVILYSVNQNPVRLNMTIPLIFIFAAKEVVMVFRR
jgi:hypothetical protein